MAWYTIKEVKIDGGCPVNEILELSMEVGANRHGLLTYGGLVPEEAAKQYIRQNADHQAIMVSLLGELEFCGYPQEIVTDFQKDHCYLRVTLVSSSQHMDTYLRDRFFQDTTYTFEDMLTEAYEDSKTGRLVAICGNEEIGSPILQYHETDWQFSLRMAARLGTVLIPNVTSAEPQVALGVPKRQVTEESNRIAYSVRRSAPDNRRDHHSYLCYKMTSDNRYKLGDSVRVNGQELIVMQKSFAYKKGEIQELYVLGQVPEFASPFYHNKRIAGLELEGKVLKRHAQSMQILLDIDSGRKDCGKSWFSYSPVTNNGMYSMPLEDEKVMLQWQSEVDNDILVVRPNRKNSHDMCNPGNRHFLTEHENHLMMMRGRVEYSNPLGSIKWLAGRGFDVSTGKDIFINAEQDVNIKSRAQVQVYSPERITACKTGVESSIDMISNELHVKAVKKVTAKSKVNKYRKPILPEGPKKFTISTAAASKLTAAVPLVSNAKK